MSETNKADLETAEVKIRDGVTISVTHDGCAKTILVRKVAWHEMSRYASVYGVNEIGEIALYCGEQECWVKLLDGDSADEVICTGRKLNEDGLGKFLSRQAAVAKRVKQFTESAKVAT